MSTVLTVGIVGAGGRAHVHLGTLGKLREHFRVVAICDTVAAKAEEAGRRWGVPAVTELEAMLERYRPDVVWITVPPEAHHTVAETAAAHGAHLLCETPIAITLPYADRMIEAARQAGVQLEVAENAWRWPQERLKRQLIEAGWIGQVSTIRMWYRSGSYHGFSAIRRLAGGRPVRVSGMAAIVPAPRQRRFVDPYHFHNFGAAAEPAPALFSESSAASWEAGLIAFDNGVRAIYEFPIGPPHGNGWEVQGTEGYFAGALAVRHATGQECTIVVETETGASGPVVTGAALYEGGRPLPEWRWENPFVRYGPSDADEVARMDEALSLHRAVTAGGTPDYGGSGGRADLELLVAVRESARLGGRPVELPLRRVTGYEARLHEVYGSGA